MVLKTRSWSLLTIPSRSSPNVAILIILWASSWACIDVLQCWSQGRQDPLLPKLQAVGSKLPYCRTRLGRWSRAQGDIAAGMTVRRWLPSPFCEEFCVCLVDELNEVHATSCSSIVRLATNKAGVAVSLIELMSEARDYSSHSSTATFLHEVSRVQIARSHIEHLDRKIYHWHHLTDRSLLIKQFEYTIST